MFTLGLTDLDLLDLGEILIAEDEHNVAGFFLFFFLMLTGSQEVVWMMKMEVWIMLMVKR